MRFMKHLSLAGLIGLAMSCALTTSASAAPAAATTVMQHIAASQDKASGLQMVHGRHKGWHRHKRRGRAHRRHRGKHHRRGYHRKHHRRGYHRRHRDRDFNPGAAIALGIIGALIDRGHSRSYARSAIERCDDRFRSFERDTGLYTTYGGKKRLCPYLR